MQLHSQTVLKQAQKYRDVKHWSWIELNKHYCIQVDSHWPPSTSMVVHRQWTSHDGTRGNVTYLPTNRIDLITYQKLHFGMNLQMTGLLVAEHILSANESCIAGAFDLFFTIWIFQQHHKVPIFEMQLNNFILWKFRKKSRHSVVLQKTTM